MWGSENFLSLFSKSKKQKKVLWAEGSECLVRDATSDE